MQPECEFKQKLDKYVTNIRRDGRQKAIKQMRCRLYFNSEPIEKVAEGFNLAARPQQPYTIMQIMMACLEELVRVARLIESIVKENGAYQSDVRVLAHVNFWAYLLQEVFGDKIQINQQVQHFYHAFMKANSYQIIAKDILLQEKVLNVLQISMLSALATPQLKQRAIGWVTGTQGLILILNSLPNHFLPPGEYPSVYQLIKQALSLPGLQKLGECCNLLRQLMRQADYDETYQVYSQQNEIMVSLLASIVRYVQSHDVSQYVKAVIYLLDSYSNVIFDYARAGVALLAARMIISKRESNVLKGLELLKFIAEVDRSEVMTFLLEDVELNASGMWDTILASQQILFSVNIAVRRQGYAILANIMHNGHRDHSECLNAKLSLPNQANLFELIVHGLRTQQDSTILKNLVIMLSVFMYYADNATTQESEEGDSFLVNLLVSYDVELLVKNLLYHQNAKLAEDAYEIHEAIVQRLSQRDSQ